MDIRTGQALISFIENIDDIILLRKLAKDLEQVKHEISYIEFEDLLNNPAKPSFGISQSHYLTTFLQNPCYLDFFTHLSKVKGHAINESHNPIPHDITFNYSDIVAFIDDITSTNNILSLKEDLELLAEDKLTKIYYRKPGLDFRYSVSPKAKVSANGLQVLDKPPLIQFKNADYLLTAHYSETGLTHQTVLVKSLIFNRQPLKQMAHENFLGKSNQ